MTTSKRKGSDWEYRVKKYFEDMGYLVSRWSSNVDLKKNKLIPARPRFNPGTKSFLMNSAGFPDFVVVSPYFWFFVECKLNGKLSAEEKKKAAFYKDLGYHFFVASKEIVNGRISVKLCLL